MRGGGEANFSDDLNPARAEGHAPREASPAAYGIGRMPLSSTRTRVPFQPSRPVGSLFSVWDGLVAVM